MFTGLLKSIRSPELIVYKDDLIVIIKDMYPKAKYHFLLIPEEDIPSIKHVQKNHFSLLVYMDKKAREFVDKLSTNLKFHFGYHSVPSMYRLHLHIISDDMVSDRLKTKSHYNSFVTNFFLKSEDIINMLEQKGKIILPPDDECEEMLGKTLTCHICGMSQKNMPGLKKHLLIHLQSFETTTNK